MTSPITIIMGKQPPQVGQLPSHHQDGHAARKLSPHKLIACALSALVLLTLLHSPLTACVHRATSTPSVEQQARDILASNPLIGTFPLLFLA